MGLIEIQGPRQPIKFAMALRGIILLRWGPKPKHMFQTSNIDHFRFILSSRARELQNRNSIAHNTTFG